MKKKNKKGFTLLETSIALALMAIVFSMSITAILTVSQTQKRNFDTKYFVLIANDYLECYKLGGKDNFEQNVNTVLGVDLATDGVKNTDGYTLSYGNDYNLIAYNEESPYQLILTLSEKGFFAQVIGKTGKIAYELPAYYLSRFDMGV